MIGDLPGPAIPIPPDIGWAAAAGLALLAGGALGVVLERWDLCFHSAFRGVVTPAREPGRFQIYLIAVLVQIPVLTALVLGGWLRPYVPPLLPVANLAGGVLFGIGMVVASSCVSGLFYKLGRGMLGALVGLGAWAAGDLLMFAGPLRPLREALQAPALSGGGAPTWGGLFGLPGWAIAAGAFLLALWWVGRAARPDEWLGGLVLGALVLAAWVGAQAAGADFPYGTVGVPSQAAGALATGSTGGVPWVGLTLLALPVGALLSARRGGRLRVRGESPTRIGGLATGGLILGVGGAIAGGCNIGHALIGVPLLATGSWLATAGMLVGVWIAAVLVPFWAARLKDDTATRRLGGRPGLETIETR